MKKKKIFELILVLFLFVGITGAASYFLLFNQNKTENAAPDALFGWKFPVVKFPSTGSNPNLVAYSDIRDPGGIPKGLPVRLKIPVIGVDSAIEDALITPDGRMDVPAGSVNVAWFALGPHPGQIGSAVIGGHYGIQNGVSFVFYDLNKIKSGDKIYIVDDKGNTLAFVVRSTKSFDRNADATPVFASSDGVAHLNLITCEGIWNQVNGSYPQRLVVFTDLIPSEGAAPASASSALPTGNTSLGTARFGRTLNVGARGSDVVELQTFLEQRGLLELPPGYTNGFFGPLTRTALAKYQASVGLPAVGTLGPLTRIKLNKELAGGPVLPNTGSPLSPPQMQTFMDWLITSSLLIAIAFLTFKFIRRWHLNSRQSAR